MSSSSNDSTIKLWDIATRTELATLDFLPDPQPILTLAHSSDGKTLASADTDKTILLWDVMSGQAQATLRGHTESVTGVAFAPLTD
jgi:WD40 repeat protein